MSMCKEKTNELYKKNEKVLLTFLKLMKKGKYAKIDDSSLPYLRLKISRLEIPDMDEYYYSYR